MRMYFQMNVVVLLFLIAFAGGAPAQSNGAGGTKVMTTPDGATVEIQGEYTLIGRAPYTILKPLIGPYRIKARKRGFENYSSTHLFRPGTQEQLSIRLTRKTRLRAGVRSLFFSGWGQFYSDQPIKGLFITTAQLASLGYLLYADTKYQKSVDDYNDALAAFQSGGKSAEMHDLLLARVNAAKSESDRRYETRRRSIIAAASVYVYNLLDALIFFPSFPNANVRVNVGLKQTPQAGRVEIGLKTKF